MINKYGKLIKSNIDPSKVKQQMSLRYYIILFLSLYLTVSCADQHPKSDLVVFNGNIYNTSYNQQSINHPYTSPQVHVRLHWVTSPNIGGALRTETLI